MAKADKIHLVPFRLRRLQLDDGLYTLDAKAKLRSKSSRIVADRVGLVHEPYGLPQAV